MITIVSWVITIASWAIFIFYVLSFLFWLLMVFTEGSDKLELDSGTSRNQMFAFSTVPLLVGIYELTQGKLIIGSLLVGIGGLHLLLVVTRMRVLTETEARIKAKNDEEDVQRARERYTRKIEREALLYEREHPPKKISTRVPARSGPKCHSCGAKYNSIDELPRQVASYDSQVNTTYCPKCGSENIY